MATATRTIGPADEGLRMNWDEFFAADFEEGHRYELIDGRLVVAATPNTRHSLHEQWLYGSSLIYSRSHSDVINFVTCSSCVVVPGRGRLTIPQPDIAAFHDFPRELSMTKSVSWRRVSPILVAEITSPDSTDKDFFRNVELYEAVPSVKEYWIVDGRGDVEELVFRVYRKRGTKWQKPIDYHYGDTYTTKLLPGFSLVIDPLA